MSGITDTEEITRLQNTITEQAQIIVALKEQIALLTAHITPKEEV